VSQTTNETHLQESSETEYDNVDIGSKARRLTFRIAMIGAAGVGFDDLADRRNIDIDTNKNDATKKETTMSTTTTALPQTSITTWNIDPAHSAAEFKVKHMMIGRHIRAETTVTKGSSYITRANPFV